MNEVIEILLVEDTPSDVRLTQEALKDSALDYNLTVVGDGVKAMDYLNELKSDNRRLPHIILLDLNMPKKNGHEVLEDIKMDAVLSPIPVVLLTVSERDEDVHEALRTKMNYYLAKPISAEKLSGLIKAIYELNTEDSEAVDTRTREESHIRLVLASNPHTSLLALERLSRDHEVRVRCRVAENERLNESLQLLLAKDQETEVRISLCENPMLHTSVLEMLIKDKSDDVRMAATDASGISASLLRGLLDDDNAYVSDSAKQKLSALNLA